MMVRHLPIDITSIFGSQGLDFFGHQYTSLYINNNGNITFGAKQPIYSETQSMRAWTIRSSRHSGPTSTRGAGAGTATPGGNSTGSNLVYESLDTTNDVLTITWDDVGYYAEQHEFA